MNIAKDKWMKYKGTSGRAVLTLCGVYGVAYLFSLQPVNRIYYSVLNVLLAVGIYSMLQQTEQNLRKIEEKRDRKRRIYYVAVISFLFALSMVMGYQLQNLGMTDCGVRGKGMILIRALCLSVAAFPFANLLLDGIDRLSARGEATMSGRYWKSGIVFAVTAVVIFLCLIPVWLAYYPIIMSYDFHRQVNEAYKGLEWFYPLAAHCTYMADPAVFTDWNGHRILRGGNGLYGGIPDGAVCSGHGLCNVHDLADDC